MDREDYQTLVEEIYDAALYPERWEAVVDKIRIAFNSISAGFFCQSRDNKLRSCFMQGIDLSEVATYSRDFAAINPWFTTPGIMTPGNISTDLTLDQVHKNSRYFLKSTLYQEWAKPQDFRHAMGGNLVDIQGDQLNFTFFRAGIAGHYSATEIQDYRSLSRHLMKAMEIAKKLKHLENVHCSQEILLDQINIGVLIVNQHKKVIYHNIYAAELLGKYATLLSENIIVAIEKSNKLRETVLTEIPRPYKRPLSVCILPENKNPPLLNIASDITHLFITDPECSDLDCTDLLIRRWRLTQLEASVTQQLLRGLSLREIAETLHLKLTTVQWYSKQIMQKLGVRRQSELCLMLAKEANIRIDQKNE